MGHFSMEKSPPNGSLLGGNQQLYEAKMIHHFDHRFGSFFGLSERPADGALPEVPPFKKLDANFEPDPWYWVPEDEVVLRAARVPTALKSAVRLASNGSSKGRRKTDADAQESARTAVLKTLVTWIAGAIGALEGRPAREGDIFRLLGRAQDWRGTLKTSPERFLLDPKTLASGAEMQSETPLTTDDLTRIGEGPKDALAVAEVLIAAKQPRYLMGWRDITNNSAERTVVGGAFPKVGVGNNLPIWYVGQNVERRYAAAFVGMLSSLTFDFAARHKVGGTHLNFFIAQQLPVLPPSAFTVDDLAFIASHVLELTYTSRAMKPWAEDLGYSGNPFGWNEDRRARLRAELDVFFARFRTH